VADQVNAPLTLDGAIFERLGLQPGDALLVRLPADVRPESLATLGAEIEALLERNGRKVAVLVAAAGSEVSVGPTATVYEAVRYALDRIQSDADFGYQAGVGTEVFHRLCVAEAAFIGKPLEEIEAERRKTFWRYEPRVLELRRELEAARG
jgi:hypothetical protein